MYYIFFGIGLEYLIILFIRSLSQDKKRWYNHLFLYFLVILWYNMAY
jgi:hypothetical protein